MAYILPWAAAVCILRAGAGARPACAPRGLACSRRAVLALASERADDEQQPAPPDAADDGWAQPPARPAARCRCAGSVGGHLCGGG
jgi:hypothetical protein